MFCIILPHTGAFAQDGCNPSKDEKDIWDAIKNSGDPNDFFQYLKQYPAGCFRPVAKFKFNALVPEKITIQIKTFFAGSGTVLGKDGDILKATSGIDALHAISLTVPDPSKFSLQFRCDAALRGLSGWYTNGQTCPTPSAPGYIQGFSVSPIGAWKDFYVLRVWCKTVGTGGIGSQDWTVADQWCGNKAGDRDRYVSMFSISASRRAFD